MNKIEAIRAKCVEANPDKNWAGDEFFPEGTVRLADVLLTLGGSSDGFCLIDRHNGVRWNLRQDDLEKQSPETIEFISSVLGI